MRVRLFMLNPSYVALERRGNHTLTHTFPFAFALGGSFPAALIRRVPLGLGQQRLHMFIKNELKVILNS